MTGRGGRKKEGEGRGSRVRLENKRGEGRIRNRRRKEREGGWVHSRGDLGERGSKEREEGVCLCKYLQFLNFPAFSFFEYNIFSN